MSEIPTTERPQTAEQIHSWLTERVGYYLQQPAAEIDGSVSFTDYGLDSVYAFALCGEIEDILQLPIEPTLVWDIDTVDALSAHLADLLSKAAHG